MLSILGKLLCRELGEQKYDMYFECYRKSISESSEENRTKQSELIFCDIYKQLRDKEIYTLQEMLERMLSAIELSIKINRQYLWVWAGTILTVILLIIMPVSIWWTIAGIVFVITGFGYKSMVFLINRYCFIDANIIMIYKTTLYHIILTHNIKKLNNIK